MTRLIRLLPEADAEFAEAAAYYEARREGLGAAFVEAVDRTITEILDAPSAGFLCHPGRSFRKRLVQKFPFVVVYRMTAGEIEITAVMHTSRRPAYWIGRARS